MIRINLLPHREEKRRARRQQFFALVGLVTVLSALIVFLGYSVIAGYISAQKDKNDFLKKEIAELDKQIAQIKTLQEQIQTLLSRKQIIESLQRDRAEPVNLLNEIAKQMPDGVYLRSMKQSGQSIAMNGYSQSNARVSTLMRNIESSPTLTGARLIETKAVNVGARRMNEFSMTATIKRLPPDDGKNAGAPAPKGK
jgi:type IV pilus assembly protein PilN